MADGRGQKMRLLGETPVSKALAALGLPIMVGLMVSALYNLVDAYFVAGLGQSAMGAIAVVFPLGQVAVGLGLLFGTGAASYVSRLLGRGETAVANQAVSTALYGAAVGAVVFAGLCVAGLDPILKLLGASDAVLPVARTYAGFYLLSLVFNAPNVAMNNMVSSEGAARTAMAALVAGAVLNVALDPVLIYGLGLGVAGAGAATVAGQLLTAGVYGAYAASGSSLFSFAPRDCRWTKPLLGEIFKVGAPTLVFQLLGGLAVALTNGAVAPYGDAAVAAMGAVSRVMALGNLMVFGFIKGLQPLVGFSYGAGNMGRLRRAIRVATLWSTGFCVAYGLGVWGFAPQILGLFAGENALMAEVGTVALRAQGITFAFFGFYTVYSSVFLALGNAGAGLLLGSCRQGICFVPALGLLSATFGLEGALYAQPLADGLAFAVAVAMAVWLRRHLGRGSATGAVAVVRGRV